MNKHTERKSQYDIHKKDCISVLRTVFPVFLNLITQHWRNISAGILALGSYAKYSYVQGCQ